jgi:hypothetical protein
MALRDVVRAAEMATTTPNGSTADDPLGSLCQATVSAWAMTPTGTTTPRSPKCDPAACSHFGA